MLSYDNNIRWNLWLTILELAIKLKNAICVFIDKNQDSIQKNNLSRDKWDTVRETITILGPFKDTTKSLEGDLTTLDKVLWSMDFLIKHVKSKQEEYAANINLSALLLTIWFAFNKYYKLTNKTPAYASVLLLNLTLQKGYLDNHWQALEERDLGTINRAIKAAQSLQKKEYKYKPVNGEQVQ